jgi:hypothetical protein
MKKRDLNCSPKQNLSIWYCEGCKSVHLRVGENLLTFTAPEFIDFASAIGELYGRASLEALRQQPNPANFEFDGLADEITRRVSLKLNF